MSQDKKEKLEESEFAQMDFDENGVIDKGEFSWLRNSIKGDGNYDDVLIPSQYICNFCSKCCTEEMVVVEETR